MKNIVMLFTVVVVLSLAVLGCNWSFGDSKSSETNTSKSSNSNKTLTDKGVDAVVGESKIGVQECDELVDVITSWANNPEDGFVAKAAKQLAANQLKDAIKKSAEENKADKVAMAKNCKEIKTQFDNIKSSQESGK